MASALLQRINDDLKTAMKARDDKLRVSTLRLVMAAAKDRDIAARANDRCCGLSDDEVLAVLTKMVKQREDSAQTYEDAGRIELAEQERREIAIISDYLPKQLSETEIQSAVDSVIADIGASGLKDMGKCMGALKERYQGAMDFSKANEKVKSRLATA
ncbi:GatB/YqeY domain-containing protein [Parvularcula sp. LCG005]|uniref:GatB/YqeY domain-containing protein n=1 Tax=Parvularcula sp. LCG005 TaxID=3078805 RepID=UPI002943F549|nr:GatB/YqeY domain-containing protein [Parvularcula sp. LCG005]WOI52047.1 GatB/YqeY domain-containing protein [Parvularcula sp. LCG005]